MAAFPLSQEETEGIFLRSSLWELGRASGDKTLGMPLRLVPLEFISLKLFHAKPPAIC